MLFQIVHISGTTIYFVFAILLFWISRVPRTDPGAGWWACAMVSAALSRMLLFALDNAAEPHTALLIYGIFTALEKSLLTIGIIRFLGLKTDERRVSVSMGLLAGWTAYAAAGAGLFTWACGLAAFNAGMLAFIAIACLRRQRADARPWLSIAALVSGLLALHWLTFPMVVLSPRWKVYGFVLGTLLALIQYMALLACVFQQFQRRLTDAESQALQLAYFDPLTGLNNKNYLSKLFEQALLLATRPHHVVALYYIDLDNFKPINDRAGHKTGDKVLQEVARRMTACMRSTDISARIGGDEFIVIATQLGVTEQAAQIAEKLLNQLSRPVCIDGVSYPLGASIGISLYPTHGSTLAALVEAADEAMYRVKSSRKNGYALYEGPAGTPQDISGAA